MTIFTPFNSKKIKLQEFIKKKYFTQYLKPSENAKFKIFESFAVAFALPSAFSSAMDKEGKCKRKRRRYVGTLKNKGNANVNVNANINVNVDVDAM